MTYQPIENYAMIGDMHSAALVATNGSIDWLCLPRFDSPSVFAAILDATNGGRFQIAPCDPDVTSKQFYWPDTNVLVTRFLAHDGAAELTDFMPVGATAARDGKRQLLRRVSAVRGTTRFRLECRPAFNYARDAHELILCETGATFASPQLHLGLATRIPLRAVDGGVVAEFTEAWSRSSRRRGRGVHSQRRRECGVRTARGRKRELRRVHVA